MRGDNEARVEREALGEEGGLWWFCGTFTSVVFGGFFLACLLGWLSVCKCPVCGGAKFQVNVRHCFCFVG